MYYLIIVEKSRENFYTTVTEQSNNITVMCYCPTLLLMWKILISGVLNNSKLFILAAGVQIKSKLLFFFLFFFVFSKQKTPLFIAVICISYLQTLKEKAFSSRICALSFSRDETVNTAVVAVQALFRAQSLWAPFSHCLLFIWRRWSHIFCGSFASFTRLCLCWL